VITKKDDVPILQIVLQTKSTFQARNERDSERLSVNYSRDITVSNVNNTIFCSVNVAAELGFAKDIQIAMESFVIS